MNKNNPNPNYQRDRNVHLTLNEKPLVSGYLKTIDAAVNRAYPVISRMFVPQPSEQQPVQTIQQRNAEEVEYLAQLREQQAAAHNVAVAYASVSEPTVPHHGSDKPDMNNPGPEMNPNYDFDSLKFSTDEVKSARAAVAESYQSPAASNEPISYV